MMQSHSSLDHMPWVSSRTKSAKYFVGEPVVIYASIDTVWNIVKDVENHVVYSKGKITTHVDGLPAVDKTIALELYKHQFVGKFFPNIIRKN